MTEQLELNHLPLLALRDVVVYPRMQIALFVGREKSIQAVEAATKDGDNLVLVVSQKDSISEDITQDNLYEYGTVARIIQVAAHEQPNEQGEKCIKVLIEGLDRVKVEQIHEQDAYFTAQYHPYPMTLDLPETKQNQYSTELVELFAKYAELYLRNARELINAVKRIDDLLKLLYFVATRIPLPLDQKQMILERDAVVEHIEMILLFLDQKIQEHQLEQTIDIKVRHKFDEQNREHFLREKMKVIQKELDHIDGEDAEDDVTRISKRLEKADLPKEARERAEKELRRLKRLSQNSHEYPTIVEYLEMILDIPWNTASEISIDLQKAEQILEEEHYGLDDVKERILEYLAVQSRAKTFKGSVLCLVGPPGVGKTSLGESIAKATGRKFVRMSMGGVRDEAEIRGHRRTYSAALPGTIVQNLLDIGVKNPLFLLDEIDKVGEDPRYNISAALLEVLDPAQNSKFRDHFLDLGVDLSEVMFICTANSMNIQPALLDRMEVIRLSGYTEDEKMNIAERYLVPRALKDNGLTEQELTVKETAIRDIVRHYTREAGVRNLQREISKIARKVIRKAVSNPEQSVEMEITSENLFEYLGVRKYDYGIAEQEPFVGRVNGLAWTSVGGELLTIEVATTKGKGNFITTGSLGDVMKESIKAALTVVKTRAHAWGIDVESLEKMDIHVHLPEGATPKDGPSAGLALTTALVSALTGIPIRPDIAMTGETTLGGRALRIGGLKEKLLAAHRGGIKMAFIPKDNEQDLIEIPEQIKQGLDIKVVKSIDEILPLALTEALKPLDPVYFVDNDNKADLARH